MNVSWLIGLLIVVAILIFFSRKKSQDKSSGHKYPAASNSPPKASEVIKDSMSGNEKKGQDPFKGCRIEPGPHACKAVLAEADRTFAAGDAPGLPLSGCEVTQCACRYIQVQGRRRTKRRQVGERRNGIRMGEDRRQGRDRRDDVQTWKDSR